MSQHTRSPERATPYGWLRDGRPTFLDPNKPATTVAGGARLTSRDHHEAGSQGRTSTNVTPREAATLQTYPLDFAFAGGNGDQCQQIGNAVPPLLAEVFLTALWSEPEADPWADVFDIPIEVVADA